MWLGIAIVGVLIVWTVGGLGSIDLLPKNLSGIWDGPGEKELRIIQAIALLLIVAGVTVFFMTEPGTFWHDLWPEMISTGGAVLGIDELNRRRSAQEYKRGIIRQMASRSNDFALDAARIAKDEGWLEDGSFLGARLWYANLKGADLWRVNLTGADLRGANFERASLREANLEGANLVGANLEGAKLWGASLTGVSIWEANLRGALYNNNTRWTDNFDPKSEGAINWDELSEHEQEDGKTKYLLECTSDNHILAEVLS